MSKFLPLRSLYENIEVPRAEPTLHSGRRLSIYTEERVQVWLVLVEDGGVDLHAEDASDETIGVAPTWYEYEVDGWESWFELPYQNEPRGPGVFLARWSRWAMENGIAPGQAFLARLEKPQHWTSYDGEVDATFETPEILEVERLTPLEVQRAWEHHLMESWRAQDELEWQHRVVLERRRTDSNALFLEWLQEPAASWNESHIIARLCSRHGHFFDEHYGHAVLCQGRALPELRLRAFARMLKEAIRLYPKLDRRKMVQLFDKKIPHWRLCRAHCGNRFKTHVPIQEFCDSCNTLISIGRRLVLGSALNDFEDEPARVFLKYFRANRVAFESAWRLGADEATLHRILFNDASAEAVIQEFSDASTR